MHQRCAINLCFDLTAWCVPLPAGCKNWCPNQKMARPDRACTIRQELHMDRQVNVRGQNRRARQTKRIEHAFSLLIEWRRKRRREYVWWALRLISGIQVWLSEWRTTGTHRAAGGGGCNWQTAPPPWPVAVTGESRNLIQISAHASKLSYRNGSKGSFCPKPAAAWHAACACWDGRRDQ